MKSKLFACFCHLVRVLRDHHFIRAQPHRVRRLPRRRREQHHVRAQRFRKLQPHVAQSAEPHDANFLPLLHAPMMQRRIRRDPRAQQRRRARRIESVRYAQHIVLIDRDRIRISAVRHAAQNVIRAVIRQDPFVVAILLFARQAIHAFPARHHHAAHRRNVAFLEFLHILPDRNHAPDNFMSRHNRIHRRHRVFPFITRQMQVRVAYAAIQNLDLHVVRKRLAPLKAVRRQSRRRALRRIRLRRKCLWLLTLYRLSRFTHDHFSLISWILFLHDGPSTELRQRRTTS